MDGMGNHIHGIWHLPILESARFFPPKLLHASEFTAINGGNPKLLKMWKLNRNGTERKASYEKQGGYFMANQPNPPNVLPPRNKVLLRAY